LSKGPKLSAINSEVHFQKKSLEVLIFFHYFYWIFLKYLFILISGNISQTSKIFETKFPCKKCFKSFHHRKQLYDHVRVIHSEKKYHCEFCDKRYTTNSGLKKHSFRHAATPIFSCSICQKNYTSQCGLRLHVQSIHVGLKFTCNLCQTDFKHKTALADHMRNVHKIGDYNMFQCDFCKKYFSRKQNLAKHIIRLHSSGKILYVYPGKNGIFKTYQVKHVVKDLKSPRNFSQVV
jgi:hypothetical protein